MRTNDFDLTAGGLAVGLFDRVELSLARQRFDAGAVVPGLVLRQDILGAKWRLTGDALYDQDSLWPQVALGLQHKRNRDMAIPEALGAKRNSDGSDLYAAFTKLWLAGFAGRNVLANLTVRSTRAVRWACLGSAGTRKTGAGSRPRDPSPLMLGDRLAVGAEYRGKPDNLSALR